MVVVGLGGCAPNFPHPLTAADVASLDSGAALVAYLLQRDASPGVCDMRSTSPHLPRFDRDASKALVQGLTEGKLDPGIWRSCLDAALDGAPRDVGAPLIDALALGYRGLALDGDLETSPPLQARLAALQGVYIKRPTGQDGDPKTTNAVFDELRRRFFGGRFGRVGSGFVDELLAVVDLEQGRYGGRPVDLPTIDGIAARGDEALLRRFADSLPVAAQRDEARRQAIRLAIAASPFPEVRAEATAVEERVFREGVNRVSLAQQPATRASLDQAKLPARNVYVRQDIVHQTATLFGYVAGGGLSVVPGLSLGGALWVDVAGLSRPITLCQAPRFSDPTPCLGAQDVTIENPLASADRDGTFHFRDRASEAEAIALIRTRNWFPLSIDVGGRPLVPFWWPIRFERPADLVLSGTSNRGPNLTVTVTHADPSFYTFTVTGNGSLYRAIVERDDLAAFRVVSRGAAGAMGSPGFDGTDGFSGMDGSSAGCPSSSGSDGTPGETAAAAATAATAETAATAATSW